MGWSGRGDSRAAREPADHRLDFGDHKLGRGVLHHVTDVRQHDQFHFGTAFANGREWMFVVTVLSTSPEITTAGTLIST